MAKSFGFMGAALLLAAPAMAAEVPQNAAFNCDYEPSCEVSPGIYGKMYSAVKSKFNLSIGGYVKLDYVYNSVNLGPGGQISPQTGAIPSRATSGPSTNGKATNLAGQDQSMLSLKQSRIWFKVDGPTFLGAKTGSLIEGDFYGDNAAGTESPMFRLRLAYGTMEWPNTQILFGQAYDMFGPMLASTIDFRTGACYGDPQSPRTPQFRVTHRFNMLDHQIKVVAAVQDPSQFGNNQAAGTGGYGPNLNYAGHVAYVYKGLGLAPGYFGMSMNPLTLTAFGEYGVERAASNNNHTLDTWGYGAYAFVPMLASRNGMDRTMTMSFEGQIYKAGNMAYNAATWTTVTGSGAGAVIPSSPNPGAVSNILDVHGKQTPAQNWAIATQLIFYPTHSLGITAGWGSRYAYNIDNYRSNMVNYVHQSTEVYANVAYDLNAAIRVAAEYQNLETVYGNAARLNGGRAIGDANIARVAVFYFF